jgi:hypothetical protein
VIVRRKIGGESEALCGKCDIAMEAGRGEALGFCVASATFAMSHMSYGFLLRGQKGCAMQQKMKPHLREAASLTGITHVRSSAAPNDFGTGTRRRAGERIRPADILLDLPGQAADLHIGLEPAAAVAVVGGITAKGG